MDSIFIKEIVIITQDFSSNNFYGYNGILKITIK